MNLKSAHFCQGWGFNDHFYVGLDPILRRLVGHYDTTREAKKAVRSAVRDYQLILGLKGYAYVFVTWESRGRQYSERI